MTARFVGGSLGALVITTFQSAVGSYIRKGHFMCPSRMTRVISWRTSLKARTSYASLIPHTRKAGTVVTLTVPASQSYPGAESSCVRTILSGTKRIRSVHRGRSRGFVPTCVTSHRLKTLHRSEPSRLQQPSSSSSPRRASRKSWSCPRG